MVRDSGLSRAEAFLSGSSFTYLLRRIGPLAALRESRVPLLVLLIGAAVCRGLAPAPRATRRQPFSWAARNGRGEAPPGIANGLHDLAEPLFGLGEFALAPKGPNTPAQGNALGRVTR